MIHGKKFSSRR